VIGYSWTREGNGKRKRESINCKRENKLISPRKMLYPITHLHGPKHADISVFTSGVSVTAT